MSPEALASKLVFQIDDYIQKSISVEKTRSLISREASTIITKEMEESRNELEATIRYILKHP